MAGLSRRFLDVVMRSHAPATRALRRINLDSLQLFYDPPPPPTTTTTTVMGSIIELPEPILEFQAHTYEGQVDMCNVACYPFGPGKVLSTDHGGRNLLFDAGTRDVAVMPDFRRHKLHGYLSIFVPSCDGDRLYFMVKDLRAAGSEDSEVLFYGNGGRATSHSKLLPLPPVVHEPSIGFGPNGQQRPLIRSYAVVDGGSQIVVSVDGGRGTYALDTASHTWSKIGDWSLPFDGKVEYVPEFKLWFGLSSGDDDDDDDDDDAQQHLHLAAADLSTIMEAGHSPPQLAAGGGHHGWEWEEFQTPEEEWAEEGLLNVGAKDVQLVSLGSGRFCIARFFLDWRDSDDTVLYFVVLTGVQVVQRGGPTSGGGVVELEMIPHKSMRYSQWPRIEQFF